MIEKLEIISDFKYIKFNYQKIYSIKNIIELYNRNIYNWIVLKDSIYWYYFDWEIFDIEMRENRLY